MENLTKTIDMIKGCTFETDSITNMSKAKQLIELKFKLKTGLFVLDREYQIEKDKYLISEEVQKGKNAEAREAMIELKFAGSKFDKINECEFLIGLIRNVESFNDNVLVMFFGKNKDKETFNV
jgi:hypothetical protein